jgi:cell division protein ZapA (FtsZ GTPase activity inhibitor)
MAGLNIAHELLRAKSANGSAPAASFDTTAIQRRISAMQSAIDRAMAEQDKLF